MPLKHFLETLDDFRFANQQHKDSPMSHLKALKTAYIEGIATIKQLFKTSLTRLQAVLEHYSTAEQMMSQQ